MKKKDDDTDNVKKDADLKKLWILSMSFDV